MYLVMSRDAPTLTFTTAAEALKKATELVSAGDSDVTILAADGKTYTSDNFPALLNIEPDGGRPNA